MEQYLLQREGLKWKAHSAEERSARTCNEKPGGGEGDFNPIIGTADTPGNDLRVLDLFWIYNPLFKINITFAALT